MQDIIFDAFFSSIDLLPLHVIFSLFLSYLIWSKCFNENKLTFENNVDKLIEFLRVFLIVTISLIYIFLCLIIINTFLNFQDYYFYKLYNIQNFLLPVYLFLLVFFLIWEIDKKKFESLVFLSRLFFFGLFCGFFFIVALFSSYKSYKLILFIYFLLLLLLIYFILISKLYKNANNIKILKNYIIFLVFGFIISSSLLLLLPNININSQIIYYEITGYDKSADIFEQKQINHTITRIGWINWIGLEYKNIDVNSATIELFYKNNIKKEVSLSKLKKEFYNGLKYIEQNNSTKQLIFQINRSKLKDVKIISLVGRRLLNSDEVNENFLITKNTDDVRNITYTFTNNFLYPVKFSDFELFWPSKDCPSYKLKEAKLWINNISQETYCQTDYCGINNTDIDFVYIYSNNELILSTERYTYRDNIKKYNLFNFSTLKLQIYLNCT